METFEKGDEESTIKIKIPQDPRGLIEDRFDVILLDPKPATSIIRGNSRCSVTIENDVIPAVISLLDDDVEILQSHGSIKIPVVRSKQSKGEIVVPWKVLPGSFDSVYVNITG